MVARCRRSVKGALGAAAMLAVSSCTPPIPTAPAQGSAATSLAPSAVGSTARPEAAATPPLAQAHGELHGLVRSTLRRVSNARGLPILRDVELQLLTREEAAARIAAHIDEDVPASTLVDQAELLCALELVPADYDLRAGELRLVSARIAGFYEPKDRAMVIVSGQEGAELDETLAHELEHALQDQSYALLPRISFKEGEGDRTSAMHALSEGDAVSASLDVELGSAMRMSDSAMSTMLALATTLSEAGATTPHVLVAELTAPYSDGFAFVQALRRRGGWAAVDEAWKHPPETTEQLLHLDKYDAREAAAPILPPDLAPLGDGWSVSFADALGEQELGLMLGEWTTGARAKRAAAGWGGDRAFVARRSDAREVAVGLQIRMDSSADANELAAAIQGKHGEGCRDRQGLGPIAVRHRGDAVVVTAGPYVRRADRSVGTASDCESALRWCDAMIERLALSSPNASVKKTPTPKANP